MRCWELWVNSGTKERLVQMTHAFHIAWALRRRLTCPGYRTCSDTASQRRPDTAERRQLRLLTLHYLKNRAVLLTRSR